MGKKNLDKLFHEKLKDFSEVPDDKVWQSLEASLDRKKKSRKVIPIWWKLGGVAAVLLIAVALLNPFEDNSINAPTVTDTSNDSIKISPEKKRNEIFENTNSNKSEIVDVQEENVLEEKKSSLNQKANTSLTSNGDSKLNTIQQSSNKGRIKNQNDVRVQIANTDNSTIQNSITQKKASAITFDDITEKNGITESSVPKTGLEQTLSKENIEIEKNLQLNITENSSEEIAENDLQNTPEILEEETKKKSIFDEIAEQEQEEIVTENTGSRWSAGPSIAPVYYDAMGEGSPVHSIFVPNSKSGDVNLSYGLAVAYEVSKKLSIKSGVHKVEYGYRTNDIAFSSSLENNSSSQIDNIDYTLTSRSLVVASKANSRIEALNQNPFLDTSSDFSSTSNVRDGVMEQQFGYLEVPVELNYALIDNKFGINLIGGISSLFLVDNSISLSSGELTTEMGEANNVNSINFSTNVGFGVNYKFTPKVQLNVEPVFKYQLNAFTNTDGTFNPFSVGVYSGLSFKF